MTFNLRTLGYVYRPLRKNLSGWDVVALQKALIGVGESLPRFGADGYFGAESDVAVRKYQTRRGLLVDGIAGIVTQRTLALDIAGILTGGNDLLQLLAKGQIESECGFQLGNYTPPYANGKRDLGVVQFNRLPTEENCWFAFDTPARIGDLIQRYITKFEAYHGQEGAKTERRAYELAAGSWNAPAWTDTLARGGTLRPEQLTHIEAYIGRVTSYVDWSIL